MKLKVASEKNTKIIDYSLVSLIIMDGKIILLPRQKGKIIMHF